MTANNQYKDMSLFKDVENVTLRNRNRGVVIGNIAMSGRIPGSSSITVEATKDLLTYFSKIPEDERRPALQVFLDYLKSEGFKVVQPNVS